MRIRALTLAASGSNAANELSQRVLACKMVQDMEAETERTKMLHQKPDRRSVAMLSGQEVTCELCQAQQVRPSSTFALA